MTGNENALDPCPDNQDAPHSGVVNRTEMLAQLDDTEAIFNAAKAILPRHLQPLVSSRYNASYGAERIATTMMSMCSLNTYAECAIAHMRQEQLENTQDVSIHTPQWFNSCLRSRSGDEMLQIGHGVLDESVSFAKKNGLLLGDLTVAMDAKEIPCYDTKPNMDDLMWTTRQKATPYARCFMTAQTTGTAIPVTLGCYPMASGEPLDYFVGHLVDDILEKGLSIGLLLMDRGFNSVRIMNELEARGARFLMRLIKRPNIVKMIHDVHNKKTDPLIRHTFRSKKYGSATAWIAVCKKADADKYERIEDKYIVLCTNLPRERVFASIDALPDIYKQRWQIETGYRIVEEVYGKTRSSNFGTRLLLFYMSLVYANLWQMVNCMRPGRRTNGKATIQGIPVKRFQYMILILIRRLFCDPDGPLRRIPRRLPVRTTCRQLVRTPREQPDPP